MASSTLTPRSVYIYILRDPRFFGLTSVRYCGKTNDLELRLTQHVRLARRGAPTYSARWIRKLLAAGFRPTLHLIEVSNDEAWSTRESYWIEHLRDLGCALTNLKDGGQYGRHSEETKQKIRESRAMQSPPTLGFVRSSESKEKTRIALKGHAVSPETRERIRAARVRFWLTDRGRGTKEILRRKRALQAPLTDEARAKIIKSLRERRCSPATRSRMRAAWVIRKSKKAKV